LNEEVDDVLRALIDELSSEELTFLSEDFYSKFLKAKVKGPLRNLAKYVLLWRLMKVLQVIVEGGEVKWNRLTSLEKEIIRYIESKLGSEIKESRKEKKYVLVKFIKKYPRILASNGKSYGPFSEGDMALLPFVDALTLKRKGVVEGIVYI